ELARSLLARERPRKGLTEQRPTARGGRFPLMRLDTSMSQRLEQKMILAPRMIQSMEILQLPVMALQERIEHELQENPVLEMREDNPEENPPTADELEEAAAEAAQCETADVASPEKELVIDDKGDNE